MPDYQPTEQDIFYIQEQNRGITETTFRLKDQEIVIIDVSSKSERRKWIHHFQDVTSILFVVNLSGYDECLVEDRDAVRIFTVKLNQSRLNNKPFIQNQMQDAMVIWDSICHSQWFRQTSMVSRLHVSWHIGSFMLLEILFLNKYDIFQQKVKTSHIKNFFPVCQINLCTNQQNNLLLNRILRESSATFRQA